MLNSCAVLPSVLSWVHFVVMMIQFWCLVGKVKGGVVLTDPGFRALTRPVFLYSHLHLHYFPLDFHSTEQFSPACFPSLSALLDCAEANYQISQR